MSKETGSLSSRPLRWGIVSTGLICNDFVIAMSVLCRSKHVVAAVAARQLQDAEKFAKQHGIEKWYGSYAELFQDPDIGMYLGEWVDIFDVLRS